MTSQEGFTCINRFNRLCFQFSICEIILAVGECYALQHYRQVCMHSIERLIKVGSEAVIIIGALS